MPTSHLSQAPSYPGRQHPRRINPSQFRLPIGTVSSIHNSEERITLNEHLIKEAEATYYMRMSGSAITSFGIYDGDLLLVDKSVEPADRSIVVAVVKGRYIVRQMRRIPSGVLLRAGALGFSDILVTADQEIWFVR
jgi:SOS-response transcriptional repressor LexA